MADLRRWASLRTGPFRFRELTPEEHGSRGKALDIMRNIGMGALGEKLGSRLSFEWLIRARDSMLDCSREEVERIARGEEVEEVVGPERARRIELAGEGLNSWANWQLRRRDAATPREPQG